MKIRILRQFLFPLMDSKSVRSDFPIYTHTPNLVYLDSTATTLKPQVVIDEIDRYYSTYSANVFRGIYEISEEATAEYEKAREVVASFIGAVDTSEVIFTRNTTESLNVIAYGLGRQICDVKSEIVVSMAEHHSNFVPWQQLASESGGTFKVVEVNSDGIVPLHEKKTAEQIITKNTKIVALFYASNVLGSVNPIKEIVKTIKSINPDTIVVVDAAQAVSSVPIQVNDLGCDFLAFSGHKALGPTGIGVLWGKRALLEQMYPFQYGGEMISEVTVQGTKFAPLPHKFEAGTPHIAGAIGLSAALKYIQKLGLGTIKKHTQKITEYTLELLRENPRITVLGPEDSAKRIGIVSFVHKKIHPHDLSQILAKHNVCIRAGHHCAMPLHRSMGVIASARASFYIYTTKKDIDTFIDAINDAEKILL
ncbi:MAG: cysteine desulfurase [Candidatus Roizmanbacteria bacterium]|nr:cysteine desulfurase [Candidatus Roizmanbacteria bacterium]